MSCELILCMLWPYELQFNHTHISSSSSSSSKQSFYIPAVKSIKHVPFSNIWTQWPCPHSFNHWWRESTINPAACSIVSAVSSQLSAVFSKYVQRILSGSFVLLQAQSQAEWRFRGEHDLLDMMPQSSTLCLDWYLCGSFHFFLESKNLTLENRV